jgi:hypothetical protein
MFTSKLRKLKLKRNDRAETDKLTNESDAAPKRAAGRGVAPDELELTAVTILEQILPIPVEFTPPGDPIVHPPPQ